MNLSLVKIHLKNVKHTWGGTFSIQSSIIWCFSIWLSVVLEIALVLWNSNFWTLILLLSCNALLATLSQYQALLKICCLQSIIYRLITAYLLMRVQCDKIMHACLDFDVSNARTWRVSALDKHQNWSAMHYFVTIFEHKVNTQLLI